MIAKSFDAHFKKLSSLFAIQQLAVPEYSLMLPIWETCHDCFEGELAVKAKDELYIYRPTSKQGTSDEIKKAWDAYKGRAKFPNLPAETLRKMVGILCAKQPEAVFEGKASQLEFMRDYATPYKDGLDALFARTVENVIRYGRRCFLLEPNENDENGFHINEYSAEKFLRAKVNTESGESYAKLILLDTSTIDYDYTVWRDIYFPQITLLALLETENGAEPVYYQAKFGKDGVKISGYKDGKPVYENQDDYNNTMASVFAKLENFKVDNPNEADCDEFIVPDKYGKTLDRIPFTCCNNTNLNFMRFEKPPLLNLCLQCIHILNADAGHQQAIYMSTDPVAVMTGVDSQEKVTLNVDHVMFLPEGASLSYVSVDTSGLSAQAQNINDMLEQAKGMGVSLAGTEGVGNTPVGTMQLYRDSQTADLRTINMTCGKAIEEQLRFAGKWIGMTPEEISRDIRFTPQNDFVEIKPSIQEIVTFANSRKSMMVSKQEFREWLEKKYGFEHKDFEELEAELDAESVGEETNNFENMDLERLRQGIQGVNNNGEQG